MWVWVGVAGCVTGSVAVMIGLGTVELGVVEEELGGALTTPHVEK